jgi:RimJ/RimL family protein N-acetyltransferase
MMNLYLRKSVESDLKVFFAFQLDEEANYMAAFTPADATDKNAYMERWRKLLKDNTINMQTIICNDEIVGSIGKYEMEGEAEITYWIGRSIGEKELPQLP